MDRIGCLIYDEESGRMDIRKGETEEHLPQYHDVIIALPDDCVAF